ncbi:hypothetical protein MKEN_01154800 [Mycena kentingensis (nom. inval.)]|nr:hypothetical protein MKEN_01154800 [Mycena kentingensis (nom. inval.)]
MGGKRSSENLAIENTGFGPSTGSVTGVTSGLSRTKPSPRSPLLLALAANRVDMFSAYHTDYNALARSPAYAAPPATSTLPAKPRVKCSCGARTNTACKGRPNILCVKCCVVASLAQADPLANPCPAAAHAAGLHVRLETEAAARAEAARVDAVRAPSPLTQQLIGDWNRLQAEREMAQPVAAPTLAPFQPPQRNAGLLLDFSQPAEEDGALFATFTNHDALTPSPPSAFTAQLPSPFPASTYTSNDSYGLLPGQQHAPTPLPSQPPAPTPLPSLPPAQTPPPPPPSQPRTRLPPASVQKRPKHRPPIVHQLNSDWMDDSAAVAVDPAAHAEARSSMYVRSGRSRGYVNPRMVKRFTAVVNVEPGEPEEEIEIDSGLDNWPAWTIEESKHEFPRLLEGLGEGGRVQVYKPKSGTWGRIRLDWIHRLESGCVVFLRRILASPEKWDEAALEAIIKKHTEKPQHVRFNLPDERAALRLQYKLLQSPPLPFSPTLPTLHLPTDISPATKRRYAPDSDDDDNPPETTRPTKRMQLSIDTTSSVGENDEDDCTVVPSSATSSSAPSPMPAALIPLPPLEPLLLPSGSLLPSGFSDLFYIDVVAGFEKMDELMSAPSRPNERKRFELAFPGRKYVQQTYSENRKKWAKATTSIRQQAEEAGRTPAGLWGKFTRRATAELNSGIR